jgi:hypothetical protein
MGDGQFLPKKVEFHMIAARTYDMEILLLFKRVSQEWAVCPFQTPVQIRTRI